MLKKPFGAEAMEDKLPRSCRRVYDRSAAFRVSTMLAALPAVAFDLLHDDRHGLMEGATEHDDEEVDGVATLVGIDPAPVVALHDEAGEVGEFEVAVVARTQSDAFAHEQGRQVGAARGLDLAARPARIRRRGGHGRSGSGVGRGRG